MSTRIRSHIHRILLAAGFIAFAPLAEADVTMEESISVSGAGLMKMANMSGKTTTTIAGDRARTDSDLRFESGLVRTFAGGMGQTSEIVRLDQDKIYSLNNKKKTYTESSFAEQRAQMQQAMEQAQKGQAAQQQSASGVDESQCEWSEPKADVKRTGERASIAGFNAERLTIVATQACTDKKTGQVCEFGLALDQWLAPDFDAAQETLAYQRAYAEKMGFTAAASRDFAERAQSMFGRYQSLLTEIASKTRDVKGHPVKASFSLGVGGPQCQSSQQAQASGSTSSPGLGGALGGALGGMFGKKKEAQPATTPPPTTINGLTALMTVSTELLSVQRSAADPAIFDVPAGYKKAAD